MTFRGWFSLNGTEIANTSRVVAHTGAAVPTSDIGIITPAGDCSLTPVDGSPLLLEFPDDSVPIADGRLLYTPPNGSRLYSSGLLLVGDCWTEDNLCFGCRTEVGYDDSWDGLFDYLGETIYRPELSPWYSTQVPESAEFGGVWVLKVDGLDTTPQQTTITDLVGAGAVAGPTRDGARKVTFDALLFACTNAGLTYGLQWLTCALRNTVDEPDSRLRYFAAHPGGSAVDPMTLVREVHGVVMTAAPTYTDMSNASGARHRQANIARVSFELTVTKPYAYLPSVPITVEWDSVAIQPIQWVHAADCGVEPHGCMQDKVLFAEGCEPESIIEITTPPPGCGGCLPVCAIATHVFEVPTFDYPMRCRESAITLTVSNVGDTALAMQAYWRRCSTPDYCDEQNNWPLQIGGLPAGAVLTLDGLSASARVQYDGFTRRPVGIVGTPTGAPWRPPVMDRSVCWEFVVLAAATAEFEVAMSFADREA